jgi:hypothetical protein
MHTPYSIDAHATFAKEVGMPADMIDAASKWSTRWRPRSHLTLDSAGLYDRAVNALGHKGITDVIVLMGYYAAYPWPSLFKMCRLAHLGWNSEAAENRHKDY